LKRKRGGSVRPNWVGGGVSLDPEKRGNFVLKKKEENKLDEKKGRWINNVLRKQRKDTYNSTSRVEFKITKEIGSRTENKKTAS